MAELPSDIAVPVADGALVPRPAAAPRAAPHGTATWRWSVLSLSVAFAGWWLTTRYALVAPLYLPGPAAVAAKLVDVSRNGYMDATLWEHLEASLLRVAVALLAALVTAVPLGILLGLNRVLRALVDPLIEFCRPVPPLAYLPLVVIWFGIGETSKVLLIYLAIFAPLVIATTAGVVAVDPVRIRIAQSLGANRLQLVRFVILPESLPTIMTGIRIALGAGWSTLVAAELIAATSGLGFMIQSASQFLATDLVVAGIIVIAIVALLFEFGLRGLQRRLSPWAGRVS